MTISQVEYEYEDDGYDHSAVARCPVCGGANLHHLSVETFSRIEDSERGTHTVVNAVADQVVVDGDLSGNPSDRRHAVKVYFECESCPVLFALEIVQHKGSTYLYFKPEFRWPSSLRPESHLGHDKEVLRAITALELAPTEWLASYTKSSFTHRMADAPRPARKRPFGDPGRS